MKLRRSHGFAVVMMLACGCGAPTNGRSAKYEGVDTAALVVRYAETRGGGASVGRVSHLRVGGSTFGVAGIELMDSIGMEFVFVAVDTLGGEHILHRTTWEEMGCGVPEHRLGNARTFVLGGRDLLAVEHRIVRDGCIESEASEEDSVHVYDMDRGYREVLAFPGTSVHYGDPAAEGSRPGARWPVRFGGVLITYTPNVCISTCNELMVWRYGDPAPARMSMAAYGWNADSTVLVVTRGSLLSQ